MVLFDHMIQDKISEYACIRYANEKQDLFYRQRTKKDADKVVFIKSPDLLASENFIPEYEKDAGNDDCNPKVFPFFNERSLLVKASNKGDNKNKEVQDEVKVF